MSPGFISGKRMVLSSNITRTDTQLCEEVNIPVPTMDALEVGNDRILISSLDEVRNRICDPIIEIFLVFYDIL